MQAEQVLIGQLTDTHVLAFGDVITETYVDNNARMAAAIATLNDESPALDLVIGTGDLVNDERDDEYDAFMQLIDPLTVPFLPLPGNHDRRDRLRTRFPDVAWADAEHLSWVTDVRGVRVIGLDSTRPGEHGGAIDGPRLEWLSSVLADHGDDQVTVLAMHHPPFASGIGWMDRQGFSGLDELAEVVSAHRVDRIVCGHMHRPMTSMFAGVVAQVGMSTVQHVALDLGPEPAVAVIDEPVGYQIHRIIGDSIVTHSRYVDPSATPIIPAWADEF